MSKFSYAGIYSYVMSVRDKKSTKKSVSVFNQHFNQHLTCIAMKF